MQRGDTQEARDAHGGRKSLGGFRGEALTGMVGRVWG